MTTFTPTRPMPAAIAVACEQHSPSPGTGGPARRLSAKHARRPLAALGHDRVDVAGP